jgi:hypothetical protein
MNLANGSINEAYASPAPHTQPIPGRHPATNQFVLLASSTFTESGALAKVSLGGKLGKITILLHLQQLKLGSSGGGWIWKQPVYDAFADLKDRA